MTKLERHLRENSVEAFILALEIINKLSVKYRLEAFVFLFCNAWELLFKAKLLADKRKIFYRKKKGQQRLSLSLDDCLSRVFTTTDDPVKVNVEQISELRNMAAHLVVPLIPADVMALFQAGVLNYARKLKEWLGIDLSDRVPLGMMALVYDIDPAIHSLDAPIIKKQLTAETISWMKAFQGKVRARADAMTTGKELFYIPVNFKLAIVKNPGKADILLGSGPGGTGAVVVEVPKNPDTTHPYRQKDVVSAVNARLGGKCFINSYDVQCMRKVHKIDAKTEFYYKSKFASPQFSGAFVDWIVEEYEKNPQFFEVAKAKSKEQAQS